MTMRRRVACPHCLESEIRSDRPRGKSWKCPSCKATSATCPAVVISFGNHYMTSRPGDARRFETNESSLARRYAFGDAELARIEMLKDNQDVDLMTPEAAWKQEAKRQQEKHRSSYSYAFRGEAERLAEADGKQLGKDWTYQVPGLGCSTIHYGVEAYFGRGVDPYTAAGEWYADNKPNPTGSAKRKARNAKRRKVVS